MKILKIILFSIIVLISFTSNAQNTTSEPPKAVLSASDIQLFIKTLKPLQQDIEKLGTDYDVEDPTTMQALAASEEIKAIFKKHGWSEDYYLKVAAITSAFAHLKIEKELQNIPEEQRAYMKQMMESYNVGAKSQLNPADLKIVKDNYEALNTYFETYQED